MGRCLWKFCVFVFHDIIIIIKITITIIIIIINNNIIISSSSSSSIVMTIIIVVVITVATGTYELRLSIYEERTAARWICEVIGKTV